MQETHFQRYMVHERMLKNKVHPFIALFLCLYLGLILPAHHHSDGKAHKECTLCIVQHQPVKAEAVFVTPAVISSFITVFSPSVNSGISSFVSVYQTRAPPAFI